MDRTRLSRFVNQRLSELTLSEPASVSPFTSVRDAVNLMNARGDSCVLAIEGDELRGIFTERDVVAKCMEDGFDWDQPLEASVLTKQPRVIASTGTVAEAIALMQQHHYRNLPVVEGSRVVGILRLGDLLRDLAEAYPEDVLNLPPRPHQVMERQEGG
ncbi:CBS domain-containing protein [Tepidiforma sp.]|uniref:CBS domain-containing protein n=1 Tax=Tepidiforma sp. TaxID=2682230 RepID=UPI002ADE034D|nr:CBS domain-containing protein [Tepidiforma sp.]